MITINTIGITIEAALARGITGQQAINLLRAISNQINDEQREQRELQEISRSRWENITPYDDAENEAQQLADLEEDAEFFSKRSR
jgi:hypothetical protein